MKHTFLLATTGLFLAAGTAFAGPALDMAQARIQAIASGDVAALTGAYAESARLDWIGGPLDGTYGDAGKIGEVWTKFATAQGAQTAEIGEAWEAANPAGSTVAVNVTFKGKKTVPVLYVATYRDGKLVNEVWQVNPPAS